MENLTENIGTSICRNVFSGGGDAISSGKGAGDAAVVVDGSISATIHDNMFYLAHARSDPMIAAVDGRVTIRNCVIIDDQVAGAAGAMALLETRPRGWWRKFKQRLARRLLKGGR